MALFPVTSGDLYIPKTTPFSSQAGNVRKRLNRSCSFWHRSVPRIILHRFGREFGYLHKIRVLPCRIFTQTLDLDNFATARRSSQVLST